MTTTNVTIDNLIDYSTQLNNLSSIATDLSSIASYLSNLPTISTTLQNLVTSVNSLTNATQTLSGPIIRISSATEAISTTSMKLATTASLSYSYTEHKDLSDSYFSYSNYQLIPEVQSAGAWIGKNNIITLVTSTNNSSILIGYRVEGNNIDLDTYVSNINSSTRILTLNKLTLGSSKGNTKLLFFAS